MTGKERLMTAFHRRKADHVPACPDISVMVPAKLTGRPFYELFLDGREHNGWTSATYSEAYVKAVKYFGMDGWYIYGGANNSPPLANIAAFVPQILTVGDIPPAVIEKLAGISTHDLKCHPERTEGPLQRTNGHGSAKVASSIEPAVQVAESAVPGDRSEQRKLINIVGQTYAQLLRRPHVTIDDLGDGRTRLVVTIIFHTQEERDGMLQSGMETGMNESYAALDKVLAA